MEEYTTPQPHHPTLTTNITNHILQHLLKNTQLRLAQKRIQANTQSKLQAKYLDYMREVEIIANNHQEPKHSKKHHKMFTEPSQGTSYQHHMNTLEKRGEQSITTPKMWAKKSAVVQRTNKVIRVSLSGIEKEGEKDGTGRKGKGTKRMMTSRKHVQLNRNLIPLEAQTQNQANHNSFQTQLEKISILRDRKIKLEQAMKAFKEQNRVERSYNFKDNTSKPFTTDYKGMIIYMNTPKMAKMNRSERNLLFKIKTEVESGITQGKVMTTTRRGFLREINNVDAHQIDYY